MADDLELIEFEWDSWNLRHLPIESPHGITTDRCYRLRDDAPRVFPAKQGPRRSASHMIVAQDEDARFWTVMVDYKGQVSGGRSPAGQARGRKFDFITR